ncbi:hypothetical protein PPL_05121 [Heterostelium album PN500]|uniref:HP domain-containing protein n=1 Tax=Heterostelium pallidum (strain ATCC 26659 / Pp 5 / PN500) TaxID=670386 RepID=D3B9H7_HETP5|nr:hypothetical protein PPL_05121 [Heterostelium album PN500]EFA81889.1 hypothetical protein PPL_05121 [Heterostelium album PN500]|eukprot:XP_020434006.1 hypothetical protein PPL_05121 [Heterostelium album PN500]
MEKDLLVNVLLKNGFSKQAIFDYVQGGSDEQEKRFRWNEVIVKPEVMAGNGYLDLLKDYFQVCPVEEMNVEVINVIFSNAADGGFKEIIVYMIEDLKLEPTGPFNIIYDIAYETSTHPISVERKLDIIKYLDGLGHDYNYTHAVFRSVSETNDIALLKHALEKYSTYVLPNDSTFFGAPNVFNLAARCGRVDMIELMDAVFPQFRDNHDMFMEAVMSNKVPVLEYLLSKYQIPQEEFKYDRVMDIAAQFGSFDVLKWLHQQNYGTCTNQAIDNACSTGKLEIVQWLHENRTEGASTDAMDNAAHSCHLDIVKWLHENRTEGCSDRALSRLDDKTRLDIVIWFHENRPEGFSYEAMDGAAFDGALTILKWLHENRTEGCTTEAMNYAACNGHLDTVKWLHDNRTEGCTETAMDLATIGGFVDILAWLKENRTEGYTPEEEGEYLINKICTLPNMEAKVKFELVKWLHENRTEGCTTEAVEYAAADGNLDLVKFLLENRTEGCTSLAMDYASSNGHLKVVKYLHENRSEGCSSKAMDNATENGHLDVVQFLSEMRTEGCSEYAISLATVSPYRKDYLKYLRLGPEHGGEVLVREKVQAPAQVKASEPDVVVPTPKVEEKPIAVKPVPVDPVAVAVKTTEKKPVVNNVSQPKPTTSPTVVQKVESSSQSDQIKDIVQAIKDKANNDKNLDPAKLEQYLDDASFLIVLSQSKEEFEKLPKWKQSAKKKEVGLF